jgi:hypothetical protein
MKHILLSILFITLFLCTYEQSFSEKAGSEDTHISPLKFTCQKNEADNPTGEEEDETSLNSNFKNPELDESLPLLRLVEGDETGDEEDIEASGEGPRGFRGIELGMHIDKVKKLLLDDPYFNYRGDPDVSFLPESQNSLIECRGNAFIERAYFQFNEEKLFTIIIELNQEKLDYYTMFTTLTGKYGNSTSLDPTEAVWIFSDVRMSLEKPLTIKYIDRIVFEELKKAGKAGEDLEKRTREEFLKDF